MPVTAKVTARSSRTQVMPGPRRVQAWARLRPYVCTGPALVLLVLFLFVPLLLVAVLSLFEWNLISPTPTWAGLDNYRYLLTPESGTLVVQSLQYMGLAVLGSFVLPIALAVLTRWVGPRSATFYQAVLFTPTVIAAAVAGLVWQFLLLPDAGPVDAVLRHLGLGSHDWLNSPQTALVAVSTIATWKFFGFNYVIALAAVSAVPAPQLEAARIDGANTLQLVRYVMLPIMAPTILFLLLTTVLQALPNVFVFIQIITQGGPSGASNNVLYESYRDAFQQLAVGPGAAASVALVVALAAAAIWQFRLLDRRVHYDH
ncbi:sugar ABC transporter permease [Streptomyces sp. 110]|uniref:Sugar ABC transporter permease n=1 Tax=Streptomyces endocoffeicus TaxID=2898945 RepID=A0ABS1Q663_9ACTN|nr:sugar ABC transporter permease [Streptomyces endocoffeicus]MBL1120166.1 sugar ABC transporter permease [Streptomyces endocoffeicus]